ncbi:hypothetical protein T8K17_09050 [Thalassobaculum sp. OXR-137]|uniref:hypothetical protein n=1 Tax=Thalassobaculum sp. OXR-137 TaxID=3100173 RepID=UPI002AC94821|nr:hypothetical protein [Thalassobaculum sp. OXR-137]WPZ36284.1 hypothetical protein T8K17_09050 [Thalassobaculum sp. OXR-137]
MTTTALSLARSAALLLLCGGVLAACGSSNREELAKFAPYGAEPQESCGETSRGVSLEDLDDDVEDWDIEEAREELGPPQLLSVEGAIRRAGWYDVVLGQKTCGTLLEILERGDQRIVTVRDLKSHEIWGVLDGKFPE